MRGKWWLALLALIIFPLGMFGFAQTQEKRYQASMGLLVDTTLKGYDVNASPFQNIDDLIGFSRSRSIETHVRILTGSDVIRRAIEKTVEDPKYAATFQKEGNVNAQFENMLRRLSIESSPTSDVIGVRVTMANPELAATVANNIGNQYIAYLQTIERASGSAGLEQLKKQVEDSKSRLTEVDKKIAGVKAEKKISDPAISSQSAATLLSTFETRYYEVQGAYDGAKAELTAARATLSNTPRILNDYQKSLQYSPMLQDVEVNLGRARAELSALRARYLDDHPDVVAANNRVKELESQKKTMKSQIDAQTTTSINTNYLSQQGTVAALEGRVASLEQQLAQVQKAYDEAKLRMEVMPQAEQELAQLLRERSVAESAFLQLDQRLKAIEATGFGRRSMAQIISPALVPQAQSWPDSRLFILIGLALGIIVAALIIMPKGDQDIYGQWNQKQKRLPQGKRPQNPQVNPTTEPQRPIEPPKDTDPYA